MKQVLRKGLKDIVVEEVPDPVLAPGHLLVRPIYSLISSGTETASIHRDGVLKEVAENPSHVRLVWDVMKAAGPLRTLAEVRAKFSEYAVLGYSGAGVVVGKDSRVEDLETGDRVAYGGEGTGHGETILVGRNLVAKVPAEVPFEHACFATLGSIAMNAVRTANIGLGEAVAVIGLGLVGQLVAQLVKLQGGVVMVIDLKPERVDLAQRLGADHALGGSTALRSQVGALTSGRGADCVIVAAASKSPAPAQQALEICRDRGRIVIVGAVGLELPWNEMYLKEIQLFMSRAYGPGSYDPAYEKQGQDYPFAYVRWTENRNMQEFLRLVSAGRISLGPLITHQYPLEEAAQAYQTILDPTSGSLAVLLRYPAADQKEPALSCTPRFRVEAVPSAAAAYGDLQVALVGAGNLARWHHLPNLKKIPKAHLRAVHSASGARGKSYARRFGAAYCCSDYDEILKDAAVDVVLIATRNPQHAAQALAAIEAGKHVFVEKPMALTLAECRDLCTAVARTGKQLTVGFNRRFAPFYREQKMHLARRAGPAVVTCRINSPGISGSYWMADPAAGGAILGEACHFVDLMYWLLDSEPVSVSAYSLPAGQKDPIGENNMVACFRFADGSIGNLTYATAGSQTSGGERVEVFAQGLGVFTEDFKRLGVRTSSRSGRSSMWGDKGYAQQLEAFLAAIREGRPAEVTARDGARDHRLPGDAGVRAQAGAHSHRSGSRAGPGSHGMRVLQIGPYPPPHGGVQTNLVDIRNYLRKQGCSCEAINITRHRRADADGVYYPANALALLWLLLRLRYDVVHLHIGGHLSGRLLALSVVCCLMPGSRAVLSFHSGGYPSSPAGSTAGPRSLRGWVMRRFDGVIAVNREIADLFARFGVPAARVRLIPPYSVSLPAEETALPDELARFFDERQPRLISVGLLEPEYDLPPQIDAMASVLERHPNVGLAILGSGSLEGMLREQIASKPYRDRILLCGDVAHEATLRAIACSDVVLRTTLYDGDSVSVREALALGTPVIATDNGMRPAGVRLIPAREPGKLVEAIEAALAAGGAHPRPAIGGEENLEAVVRFYRELSSGVKHGLLA